MTDPFADEVSRAELAAVLELTAALAGLVNVGHGRDPGSRARAAAFTAAWTGLGGEIGSVVSWPAAAASWLRPASRLVAGSPDAWVVADGSDGWRGVGPRLLDTGRWRADRTVGFAGLGVPELPLLAGREVTDGLRGAGVDGRTWSFGNGLLRLGQPRVSNGSA
ncbi:hypothetical protein [Pseudonocardia acaciae]|uniref:hypothetical protein n=1 Tax=Pseudonocardia acaciae TaxID=551276 RepID=UPI000ADE9440|nr:hypothetical protein [Pseudonocardia acaciae]